MKKKNIKSRKKLRGNKLKKNWHIFEKDNKKKLNRRNYRLKRKRDYKKKKI